MSTIPELETLLASAIEVTDIKIFKCSPTKCRLCENTYEGCCSPIKCPFCGCLAQLPLNHELNNIK